jgi:hypothetical protein
VRNSDVYSDQRSEIWYDPEFNTLYEVRQADPRYSDYLVEAWTEINGDLFWVFSNRGAQVSSEPVLKKFGYQYIGEL